MLLKPVEPSQLIEVVSSYIDRNLPRGKLRDKTVLLIDDDSVQLKLATLAFSYAGFDVEQASDGVEGLTKAREIRPDLIVSDVLMPGLDGFQLCHAIRTEPLLQHTPVVLTSAHYLETEDRALAAKFGANDYVSRSVGFEQVLNAALLALESNTPGTAAPPPESLQSDYLRRIAHQLERQAALNTGLAQRASLQATALSVLEGISDSLAGQLDPESALEDTLTQCLDAAGLSVGAIMIQDAQGTLTLKAHVGGASVADFERHLDVFRQALQRESLSIPSPDAGPDQLALLETLGVRAAIWCRSWRVTRCSASCCWPRTDPISLPRTALHSCALRARSRCSSGKRWQSAASSRAWRPRSSAIARCSTMPPTRSRF